ncbi:hypothetical protein CBER1_05358 [Cercospora berteroae]|uniref:Uncharacterized protein n=1 Tax=Cercospora berteroae TaxID=357750 RepID=A0A2S6CHK9_9PEZI|nr:hypothetical protein CBER1_05358 [Cercospora berteroae]
MFQNFTPQKSRSHRAVRQPSFLNQNGRPPYYEDIYRSRDPGEDDEGSAEQCESESDSDVPVRTRSKKKSAKVNNEGSRGQAISISSGSEESDEEDVLSSSKSVDKSPRDLSEDHQYQIAPILNPKHSLPRAEVRRLKARRCGLFSGAFGMSINALHTGKDDGAVADDEQSDMPVEDAFGGRAKQESVKRRSVRIQQQWAERVAARKQAQKAGKQALRQAGKKAAMVAGTLNHKGQRVGTKQSSKTASEPRPKPKMRTSIGSKSSKPAAQQHGGALRAAVVMVDNRGINLAEYQRYDADGGAAASAALDLRGG